MADRAELSDSKMAGRIARFFINKLMQETLYEHHTSIFIGDRPITTYDSPMTSIPRAAAMVNYKTSSTDSYTEQRHTKWKSAKKRAKITARTTSALIIAEVSEVGGGDQFQVPGSNPLQG